MILNNFFIISGRILNRFSKDMGNMDEQLPRSFLQCLQTYLSMASILILNAISLPWTLILTVLLFTVFTILLRLYLNAAQSVKRLEGTSKCSLHKHGIGIKIHKYQHNGQFTSLFFSKESSVWYGQLDSLRDHHNQKFGFSSLAHQKF